MCRISKEKHHVSVWGGSKMGKLKKYQPISEETVNQDAKMSGS